MGAIVKALAMLPVGVVILLGGFVFSLGGVVRVYFVYRDDDGLITGMAYVGMIFHSLFIAGQTLIPTLGALIGDLVGGRRGQRGTIVGVAIGAFAAPVALTVIDLAVGDTLAASTAPVTAMAAAVIFFAVLLHQHARRRTVGLNSEGPQPPG